MTFYDNLYRTFYLAMMLPVEGGGAKVNESDLCVLHLSHIFPLTYKNNYSKLLI